MTPFKIINLNFKTMDIIKKKTLLYLFIMFLTGGLGGLWLGMLINDNFNTDTKLIFHIFGIIGLLSTAIGSFIQWRYLKKMSLVN